MKISLQLNKEQRTIVEAPVGNTLVLAVPGSGKTTTMIHRIAYLARLGFNPEDFFVVTFTRNAAKEMKERLSHFFRKMDGFRCGTFHSLSKQILDEYQKVSQDIYHVDEFQFLFRDFLKSKESAKLLHHSINKLKKTKKGKRAKKRARGKWETQ